MNPDQSQLDQLERDFALFWQQFDPHSEYSACEKTFFRHIWLILRAFRPDYQNN